MARTTCPKTNANALQDNNILQRILYVVAHNVAQLVRGTTITKNPHASTIRTSDECWGHGALGVLILFHKHHFDFLTTPRSSLCNQELCHSTATQPNKTQESDRVSCSILRQMVLWCTVSR